MSPRLCTLAAILIHARQIKASTGRPQGCGNMFFACTCCSYCGCSACACCLKLKRHYSFIFSRVCLHMSVDYSFTTRCSCTWVCATLCEKAIPKRSQQTIYCPTSSCMCRRLPQSMRLPMQHIRSNGQIDVCDCILFFWAGTANQYDALRRSL